MYTPEDIENIVIDYLTPELQDFIAGNLTHTDERQSGSDEDVTVGMLSLTDGNTQRGIVLISIYLKDIGVTNAAAQKVDYKPNKPRFDAITRKVFEILGGNAGKYWPFGNLWVTNPSPVYKAIEAGEHFRSIRVQVKAHLPVEDPVT